MTAADIRRVYDAVPFAPFRIHMANGKSADVPHPEFMHLFRNGRRLIVEHSDDDWELIDTSLVTSIETLPKNGSRKRERRHKPNR